MTTSKLEESERRGGRRAQTYASYLATKLRRMHPDQYAHRWPSERWLERPDLFFLEVLGVRPWAKQLEAIRLIRDHPRVAIKSGHKVSKSHTAAGIALWFFCTFLDARVVMSSVTARQVDRILWRELRMMHARSGRCADCKESAPRGATPCPHSEVIGGEPGMLARTGLHASDFREIVGFTAKEAEAVAGVSGRNLLYLLDEASGIPDAIFEAIEGNRAGGARVAMFSNPTRTEGEFFEAFTSKSEFYATMTISSEDSPNVIEGREVISGLATREWVHEKAREWGPDSPLYKIRIKGDFVLNEEGKIISVALITEAEQRWHDTIATGRLFIGLDPAGPGEDGDETAIAVRRGAKVLAILGRHGLSEDAIVQWVLGTILEHKEGREVPVVIVDALGQIGVPVCAKLRVAAEQARGAFEVYGIRSSDKAYREPQIYDRVRDELWANCARWLRDDQGAIPEDTRLAKELHAPDWVGQLSGKLKATDKREIRKKLGHSPDRADAVCLSVWEPTATKPENASPATRRDDADPEDPTGSIDPYDSGDAWGR